MGEKIMWDDCHHLEKKERTRHGGMKSQHSGCRGKWISVGLRPAWSTEDRTGRTVTQRNSVLAETKLKFIQLHRDG